MEGLDRTIIESGDGFGGASKALPYMKKKIRKNENEKDYYWYTKVIKE